MHFVRRSSGNYEQHGEMRFRYSMEFRCGIAVFAICLRGIAVLSTPQCPPLTSRSTGLHKGLCGLQNVYRHVLKRKETKRKERPKSIGHSVLDDINLLKQ